MKYFVRVEDHDFTIDIGADRQMTVNDDQFNVDYQQLPDSGVLSILINNRSWVTVVEKRDDIYEVLIKGELYEVAVQDERSYRLARARGEVKEASGEITVQSPMPGVIVKVPVEKGQRVTKGETVVILESMKMENELKSPREGVVLRVNTAPGATVEKGQDLVIIGDPEED